jgi:copper(I)-binding protein
VWLDARPGRRENATHAGDFPLRTAGVKLKRPAPLLRVALVAATNTAVAITEGWFRALPPSVPSGAYFTLRNGGGKTIILTGADSPARGMLMLHRRENKGGMGSMAHVMEVDVPAGGTLAFAPGGYHLMCMDARPVLKPGAEVPVTLRFKDGQSATARFQVRNAAGK